MHQNEIHHNGMDTRTAHSGDQRCYRYDDDSTSSQWVYQQKQNREVVGPYSLLEYSTHYYEYLYNFTP
jgi:hypothetical protein